MVKKQCIKCNKEFEVADNETYKRFCSIPCYKARDGQTVSDPYVEGQVEVADRLSPVEFGMIYSRATDIARMENGNHNIEENFKALKEVFLKLKKEHQR